MSKRINKKGKICLAMLAMIFVNSSFTPKDGNEEHIMTKIDKDYFNEELNKTSLITILPEELDELDYENLDNENENNYVQVLENNEDTLDLSKLSLKEIYELGEDKVDEYYNTYGYTEAINYVLEHYNLTEEEFKVLCAIVMAEANPTYTDTYAVINTMYNRTKSKSSINFVQAFDLDGHSLYCQAITPNQFIVYENGNYKTFYGTLEGERFRAILDFLISEKPIHNYLNFLSNILDVPNSVQFVEGGNKYFSLLTEQDRVSEDKVSLKQ